MQTLSRDHPSLVKSRQAPESYPSCPHHDLLSLLEPTRPIKPNEILPPEKGRTVSSESMDPVSWS